jgi:hypothetical protein
MMIHPRRSQEAAETYRVIVTVFFFSMILGGLLTGVYLFLGVSLPSQLVAGFTEPIATKLFAAIAVVWWLEYRGTTTNVLRERPIWFAFIGGITIGVVERILYVLFLGETITIATFIAPLMHTFNAILIAGLIFANADHLRGVAFYGRLLVVMILAIVIHFSWNLYGLRLFQFPV